MDGYDRRPLDWMKGSPRLKPDWRLRRAEYLLDTGGRPDRRIDDTLIKRAKTEIAKALLRDTNAPARHSTIQEVHELSRTSDSPLRWRLEAYLLTDLPFREIGEILKLDPRFVTEYHNLAFDVRPRSKATDWLTCYAMGRETSMEYVWKAIARSGGPKLLEIAIAITTGSPFPEWMQHSFTNPKLDDAILRMRGKLMIGAMLARTREQWRALVVLRRKLRRHVPTSRGNKGEARLQVMLSLLTKVASDGNTLDENQPIRAPEPFTSATMTPEDSSSQCEIALSENTPSVPAVVSVVSRRKSRGHHQQVDAAAAHDPEELPHDVVEFMKEEAKGTGPLAFAYIEIDESNWSAFTDESEARTVTVSVGI